MSSFQKTALAPLPVPIILRLVLSPLSSIGGSVAARSSSSSVEGRRGQPIGLFDRTADYDDDAVQIKRRPLPETDHIYFDGNDDCQELFARRTIANSKKYHCRFDDPADMFWIASLQGSLPACLPATS